jgi:type I restriction enzyme S subunit
MTSEWKEFCWGDIATLEYGKSLRNYKKSTGQYPVFGTNGQIGTCDKPLVDDEGVIIGRKGAYREVHFSKDPFFVIDTAFYLKLNDPTCVDISFAYYQLLNLDINSLDSGSAIPSTSREDFYSLPVKLPPIEEQHRIVEILKSLDDKIELNRRMNVTLEQIAQAIFKQWFIDFEFPDENGQPYKSSGGEMVESGLGEIPRGWEVKELKDVCSKICNGGTPARKKKEYWENGTIPWIKTKELCDTIILNSEEKITQEGLDNSAAKLLGPNTVIIAIYASPTVGRLGVVGTHAATNQACTALIADESQYSHYHIFYSLLFLRDHLNNLASGSAQQNISKSIIEKQNILLPPKELLDKSTIGFSNIWKLIENNLWEINYLTQLRDSLLPKLMSGNLRCGVVKRMLEGKT